MPALQLRSWLGLILAALLGLGGGRAAAAARSTADEPGSASPVPLAPRIRTIPGPQLLGVQVLLAPGTQLATDGSLRIQLSDGYFSYAHRASNPVAPARTALPLFRERRVVAWSLEVAGRVCAAGGAPCVPFALEAQLARGQLRQVLATQHTPPEAPRSEPVFGSPAPPPTEAEAGAPAEERPARPGATGETAAP